MIFYGNIGKFGIDVFMKGIEYEKRFDDGCFVDRTASYRLWSGGNG